MLVVGLVLRFLGVDTNGNAVPTNTSFSAEILVFLLPAIWGIILNCLSSEETYSCLNRRCSSINCVRLNNSASKQIILDFITRAYGKLKEISERKKLTVDC